MGKLSKLFGFHWKKTEFLNNPAEDYEKFHKYSQNGLNVAGWIPGLGGITGILRTVDSTIMLVEDNNSGKHKSYYVGSYMRGLVELIGLGFVFIPADIVVTIKRKKRSKQKPVDLP